MRFATSPTSGSGELHFVRRISSTPSATTTRAGPHRRKRGHSDVSMSSRYVHPSEDAVLSALVRLGGAQIGHNEVRCTPSVRQISWAHLQYLEISFGLPGYGESWDGGDVAFVPRNFGAPEVLPILRSKERPLSAKNSTPGAPRNDDRHLARPTASPVLLLLRRFSLFQSGSLPC